MATRYLYLACLCGASVCARAESRAVEVEVGIVVDVFSESYGAGDLFTDISDLPGQTDEVNEEEPLRITNDETLVGASLGLTWSPDDRYDRRLELDYEQNEASATGDVVADWRFGNAEGWGLEVDERLRMQFGLADGDDSRDVLQSLDLELSRAFAERWKVAIIGEQTFSRVSGDSLSRLFDYTIHGLGVRLDRRMGTLDARWKVDCSYRDAANEFSSNDVRVRAGAELHRYAFTGTSFDVSLLGTRRAYDDSGIVSPSSIEGELDGRLTHPLGNGFELNAEGAVTEVQFDDPDATYFDYGVARGEIGAGWSSITGFSVDAAGGGEWLRPRGGETGAYDQSRVRLSAGYLGLGKLWVDVEESFGVRNYLGASSTGGLLTDQVSLDLVSSDFFFSELSVLFGYGVGNVSVDAYAQYTIEEHDLDEDDVSFVLVNMRVTSRF